MVRHPHIATLVSTVDQGQDNEGNFVLEKEEVTIKCQVDLRGGLSNGVNYSGKVYLERLSDLSKIKEKELIFEGRSFKIILGTNYQKHCELWLE